MPLVLALLFCALLAAQQTPARDTRLAVTSGTAVIRGKVADAQTGAPIAGAVVRVALLDSLGLSGIEVETTAAGAFEITGLSAGEYVVSVTPGEYRASHLPQTLNNDSALPGLSARKPSLVLNDGDVHDGILFKLERGLAIEGRVVDELGEPLADVTVTAEYLEGTAIGRRSVYTDDRGVFRLFGLSPGTYEVCASPRSSDGRTSVPIGEALPSRYVETCYPASRRRAGARVTVNAAAQPTLTLQMQRSGTFSISGTAVSESGATNVRVHVERVEPFGSGDVVSAEIETTGRRFVARGLVPGDYRVRASAGGEPIGRNVTRMTEHAAATVRIDAADVTGIELVTSKGAVVAGRIVAQGSLPASVLTVTGAAIADGQHTTSSPSARVRDDFTFELRGVHDPLIVDVTGLPPGWTIASVRHRDADITDVPTRFPATTEPGALEVTVTPRSGRVAVKPVNQDGQPVPGVGVMLISTDPASRRIVVPAAPLGFLYPSVGKDGEIELPAVRPGEYVVTAISTRDLAQLQGNVGTLLRRGEKISVAEGEHRVVTVVVTQLPEQRR